MLIIIIWSVLMIVSWIFWYQLVVESFKLGCTVLMHINTSEMDFKGSKWWTCPFTHHHSFCTIFKKCFLKKKVFLMRDKWMFLYVNIELFWIFFPVLHIVYLSKWLIESEKAIFFYLLKRSIKEKNSDPKDELFILFVSRSWHLFLTGTNTTAFKP